MLEMVLSLLVGVELRGGDLRDRVVWMCLMRNGSAISLNRAYRFVCRCFG